MSTYGLIVFGLSIGMTLVVLAGLATLSKKTDSDPERRHCPRVRRHIVVQSHLLTKDTP